MNLSAYPQSTVYRDWAIALMSLGGAAIVAGLVFWIRHRRLMFIPQL